MTVWPTHASSLGEAPGLHDFEVRTLCVNCITPIEADTPQPPAPHVLFGGLVKSCHEHGFEIALSSHRAETSPVYVRALGKLRSREGSVCAGLIELVELGDAHVWMLAQEFKVGWKPFKRVRKRRAPQAPPPAQET